MSQGQFLLLPPLSHRGEELCPKAPLHEPRVVNRPPHADVHVKAAGVIAAVRVVVLDVPQGSCEREGRGGGFSPVLTLLPLLIHKGREAISVVLHADVFVDVLGGLINPPTLKLDTDAVDELKAHRDSLPNHTVTLFPVFGLVKHVILLKPRRFTIFTPFGLVVVAMTMPL